MKKFNEFTNEIFSSNWFANSKKSTIESKSKVEECVDDIIKFLDDNQINDWTEFTSKKFNRFVVDKLIDSYCASDKDVDEVKFKLRLNLCNIDQLKKMLSEYESLEEYEKCQQIVKSINNHKN